MAEAIQPKDAERDYLMAARDKRATEAEKLALWKIWMISKNGKLPKVIGC